MLPARAVAVTLEIAELKNKKDLTTDQKAKVGLFCCGVDELRRIALCCPVLPCVALCPVSLLPWLQMFSIQTTSKTLDLLAGTAELREQWVSAVQGVIAMNAKK